MSHISRIYLLLILGGCAACIESFTIESAAFNGRLSELKISMAVSNQESSPLSTSKKVVVGFTTDAWNVGMRKYKDFLAVNKMAWKIQKLDIHCVEVRISSNGYDRSTLLN